MSKLQVDEIVNKEDTSSVALPRGVVVTGVATATTFDGTATEASAAASGSALETTINSKTSPGKAIALSMVFG
jgi:hypothetical protein|tara:strand:+ start:1584 stop:1802 length:219 start_codon:yes stop_codon:yes gene_type:complete